MRRTVIASEISIPAGEGGVALEPPRGQALTATLAVRRAAPWLSLAGVVGLSLALNTWSLSRAGYGNTYYAAAVRSMTLSWKNFFFASFDPGGFITVDKPPVFLWAGALSARIFGYSTWSLLLPSACAGAASVALVWLIVRRRFGVTAATIAGLALTLTPISVAVNRLNLPEPFMILALVGAAGALIESLESRRWWAWTALAGFLVGVAFNTKMLAAWIPGPAFALAIVFGMRAVSADAVKQAIARLAVLGAVTLVVSASWMIVVDAWPASDRPYVGGSTNNTELDLALGYNGFGRVDGDSQGGGGGGARPGPGFGVGQRFPINQAPQPPANNNFNGPGGIVAGAPGPLRMLDDANGGQIGWLLPFAVGGGLFALWFWRRDPVRRAFIVMLLGWVALYGGVFSYAEGIFHTYYTSAMAPAVAALVGVGGVGFAEAARRDRRWLIAAVALVGVTVWSELEIAGRTPEFYGWVRPLAWITSLAGVAAAIVLATRRRSVSAGLALGVAGMLMLPAAWSLSAAANTSLNATLPQAGPRQGVSGATFGSLAFDDGSAAMASWLESHSDEHETWQLVVPNSQGGSRLIAQYGLSVMSLGGFLGRDKTISVAGFADLVSAGKVRYVLTSGMGPGGPGGGSRNGRGFRGGPQLSTGAGVTDINSPSAVLAAVQGECSPVNDRTLPSQYRGSLYDCAGAGAQLARSR